MSLACGNPDCKKEFDSRQGRLFRFHKAHPAGEAPPNTHSVQHLWLCGKCSEEYTLADEDVRRGVVMATICGKPQADIGDAQRMHIRPCPGQELIFRVLDLCLDVDPSQVTVKFHGPSLEILARKAQVKPRQEVRAAAA